MIPTIYKNIIKVVILLSLILILAIVYFEAGKAKIEITTKSQDRVINFATAVTASGADDSLIGRIIQTDLEKSKTFATPATEIAQGQASGLVTIINNNTAAQALVATTRLLTPTNLLFRIQSSVNVPAGGQVEVLAKADQDGDQYLIGPTKFTIPGLNQNLQQKIYAESSGQMTLEKITAQIVSQEVYDQAKNQLIDEIKGQTFLALADQLGENETIKEDALAVEILSEETNIDIGEKKNDFSITLKTKVKTLAFNETELRNKIIEELQGSLAAGDQAEYDNPQMTLQIELSSKDLNNIATITGQYQIKVINKEIDLNKIKGLAKQEAEAVLNNLDNVESAQVSLWPFWLTKVPVDEGKIELVIN